MAVLHKTQNEVLLSTQLGYFPMRARVFPECKMAASTVYKHFVLDVAILHPGNTHALIGKFCNYVLGKTSFREWIYGDWSLYIQSPCLQIQKCPLPNLKIVTLLPNPRGFSSACQNICSLAKCCDHQANAQRLDIRRPISIYPFPK